MKSISKKKKKIAVFAICTHYLKFDSYVFALGCREKVGRNLIPSPPPKFWVPSPAVIHMVSFQHQFSVQTTSTSLDFFYSHPNKLVPLGTIKKKKKNYFHIICVHVCIYTVIWLPSLNLRPNSQIAHTKCELLNENRSVKESCHHCYYYVPEGYNLEKLLPRPLIQPSPPLNRASRQRGLGECLRKRSPHIFIVYKDKAITALVVHE